MSHLTYDEKWKTIQNSLTKTLNLEPSQADRRTHRSLLANLYIRYIRIANRLSECVDQVVQPQKLRLLRKLLEGVLGRVVELKSDLVEGDLCDYTYLGDTYEELNVTPLDAELKIPKCFVNERQADIDYRDSLIDDVLKKLGYLDKVVEKKPMTEQQAILLIQTHERARQGRAKAQYMKELKMTKEKSKQHLDQSDDAREMISLPAALRIQKIWRGYIARRQTKKRKIQEMLLIGMIPYPTKQSEILKTDKVNALQRSKLQKQRIAELHNSTKEIRTHLEATQKGAIVEQLGDQVRNWFNDYLNQTGKIPEYPTSERSTSRMMMSRQGTESEMSKSTQVSSKDSKTKKSKTKKEQDKTAEEEDETASKALVSVFIPELTARKEEYDEVWRNKDENTNPSQLPYKDMIEQEQVMDLENELKKVVDEMMLAELELLQDALEKDRGHKGKRVRKSSKKTRKTSKKSKKKKEKDLTPDRSLESLIEELVANGILKSCTPTSMSDFIGEKSYWNCAAYNAGPEQRSALGDLRQILTEFCAIPLATPQLHETTPHLKSLLLAGAVGSGKDMLIHAVCTEIGAALFDLTPANIVGKYPGKSGLTMLTHLVTKVARLLQPSVIYMDNAERPFVKKIPKTDKTDPKRLKKDLPRIVKNFVPEDRVMLIGCSSCPWECDQKLLQQVYQKFILIPRPDYSSRFGIWTHLLRQYSAISWQFDISGLSRVSDGYTIGSIVSTLNEIMTVKRVLQLRVHPLSTQEIIGYLCRREPVYKEEEEAMTVWWTKAPMPKRRQRAIELLEAEELELQTKQASAKR